MKTLNAAGGPSRTTWIAAVVAVFSILAAINAYFFAFAFAFADEAEYWTLAQNLARSGSFSYDGATASAYRPPLLAWALTPLAATGMAMPLPRVFCVFFFAATGALSGLLLCRVFPGSRLIPPLGAAFVLGHPLYFFSAGHLFPQQILTPLLLAALIIACQKPVSPAAAVGRAAALGLLAGASILGAAPALFTLLPIFVLLAWEDWMAIHRGRFSQAYRTAVAAFVMILCVVPWIVRNAANVHSGLYLTLNSGINLFCGNAPDTTPTSGVNVDFSQFDPISADETEFQSNQRLTQAALANIRQDPWYYVRLYPRKFAAGLGNTVETFTHGRNERATLLLWGYMLLAWIGAGICLAAFWRKGDAGKAFEINWAVARTFALLVLAAYFLSNAGYAFFFTRLRFRIPVDAALALVSAMGWGIALFKYSGDRFSRRSPLAGASSPGK